MGVFDWFSRKPELAAEPQRDDCPHDDWEIRGGNTAIPPCGTCLKCGKEVQLHILLNNWKNSIERELKKHKD